MKIHFHLAALAALTLSPSLLRAETDQGREFNQLKRDEAKAVAAAVAPVQARYEAALEQLLKRATQANDLDTALKIREELAALGAASRGKDGEKPRLTAETLPHFLAAAEWTWADSAQDAKDNSTHVSFTKDGQFLMSGKPAGTYKVLSATSVQLGTSVLKLSDDYQRFEVSNWKGAGHSRFGERLK